MLEDYQNKVCVVTGAASGIGKALCEKLVALGAQVYALDRNKADIEGLSAFVETDLSDKESIRMFIMKDFTDGTDTLRQLKAKRSETLREIEKNYTNVIANVESMKNAKTAVEYLEKLGFDLSALIEADNHPVTTALTVEVDTKFLFIGGEKK